MSSTSNVQNLLTNVFRPVFTYDATAQVYQTKLELANVDTVSANAVTTYAVNVGDEVSNVYVGVGAGNIHSQYASRSNANDTFIGTSAGNQTTNVQNAVFLGYRAGASASSGTGSISIGANSTNGGNSNIYIGSGTGITTGSNNIFLGSGLSTGRSGSNMLLIGSGTNTAIVGDLATNRVGINMATLPIDGTYLPISFDVSGYARIGTTANGGLGINTRPGEYALDVNGIARSSGGFFSVSGVTPSVASSGDATIGLLKKGMLMLSVQDTDAGNTYLGALGIVTVTGSTYQIYNLSSNAHNISLSNSSSNLQIVNSDAFSAHIYTYSITYFPMP
jgi:hypothetical protein